MALLPIDSYPPNQASGIARNISVWVQFNKTLNTSTVSYVTVSVACPNDNYIPVEGTVTTIAGSGGYADTIIRFDADAGFDGYKWYMFAIQGGKNGIKSYDGDTLVNNLQYYFKTGGQTTENEYIPATGIPEPSAYIPTAALAIEETFPANYATNVPVNTPYIMIRFNDALPTDVILYDKIKLIRKDVL